MPRIVAALVAAMVLVGCVSVPPGQTAGTGQATTSTAGTGGSLPSATASRLALATLSIDDSPSPQGTYRRDDWPTWEDTDGDGCDARNEALIAQATTPAVTGPGCKVISGAWRSPYDGIETDKASDFDIDHLVPLENAFQSGGWQWDAARRRLFANDQAELVVVSAHSNRSKGSKSPADWRPPLESYWCSYATKWVAIKAQWKLSVTTRERDALGQMLDRCPA